MQNSPKTVTYALAHGSFAGVPEDATNLRTSKPVRLGRGGAILLRFLSVSGVGKELYGSTLANLEHQLVDSTYRSLQLARVRRRMLRLELEMRIAEGSDRR